MIEIFAFFQQEPCESRSEAECWSKLCRYLTESMKKVDEYAQKVPGFASLPRDDQEVLLKIHGLDLMTLRLAFR